MINFIRVSIAAVFILGAGLIGGEWTNRFGSSAPLAALESRLDCVPMNIGGWRGRPFELSSDDRVTVGAAAYFSRIYTDPTRGVSISVLLLAGLPSKISSHTPDVCFTGAGYTLGSSSIVQRPDGSKASTAEFATAVATRGGTSPSVLRVFWGWNAGKRWSAPASPRWEFGSEPVLCKLHLVRETRAR